MKTAASFRGIITSLPAIISLSITAHGAELGFTPNGATAEVVGSLFQELGTRFRVYQPIPIMGLAYYDHDSDGLVNPHGVRLWDDAGNLIAEKSVSSDSPLFDGDYEGGSFRFEPINITLDPGTYRISGRFFTDFYDNLIDPDAVLYDNAPADFPTAASGITYLSRVFTFIEGEFPETEVNPTSRARSVIS